MSIVVGYTLPKFNLTGSVIMLKQEKGLLIVDLQNGFHPSPELVFGISAFAESFQTIVMTRFTNLENSLYRTVLDWNEDGGNLVLNFPKAIILEKCGYGLSTLHLEKMKDLHCTEWHVCGLETDACVLACCFSLWDAQMRPIFHPSLCESPLHKEGVSIAFRQFGNNKE